MSHSCVFYYTDVTITTKALRAPWASQSGDDALPLVLEMQIRRITSSCSRTIFATFEKDTSASVRDN